MKQNNKDRYYKTSSIVLAATLIHEGLELVDLEPITSTKGSSDLFHFVFKDTPERAELVMKFSNNSIKVVPAVFMENIRQLKQRTREYRSNH